MTNYNELRDGQKFYGNGYKKGYEDAKKEYARPQGEWLNNGVGCFKCSICGRGIATSISENNPSKDYPFCHCGAEMKKGGKRNGK